MNRCFICEAGLLLAVAEKGEIACQSIFQPDANQDNDSDSSDGEEDNGEEMDERQVNEMTAVEAAAAANNLAAFVANLPSVHTL